MSTDITGMKLDFGSTSVEKTGSPSYYDIYIISSSLSLLFHVVVEQSYCTYFIIHNLGPFPVPHHHGILELGR